MLPGLPLSIFCRPIKRKNNCILFPIQRYKVKPLFMRTPILLFFLFIFSINVFPQQIPVLTDSDMVNQSDFGKKIGWCKIKLDANFRVTTKESETKYEYYKFTTSGLSLFFEHKGNLTAVYKNENTDAKATLLDGIVDFYDPQMHLVNRYFFKNGFLIKELYF